MKPYKTFYYFAYKTAFYPKRFIWGDSKKQVAAERVERALYGNLVSKVHSITCKTITEKTNLPTGELITIKNPKPPKGYYIKCIKIDNTEVYFVKPNDPYPQQNPT